MQMFNRVFFSLSTTLLFLVSSTVLAEWDWNDKSLAGLKPEEVALLQQWAAGFPRLVEKYSQLTVEYSHESEYGGVKRNEYCRIHILGNDHYRWDIETDEGIQVSLVLPGRCYQFARKKDAKGYVLLGKGGDAERMKMIQMLLSTDVVRAPFADGFIPLWYEFGFLDNPSYEHFWVDEMQAMSKNASAKLVSVAEQGRDDGNRITLQTETTIDGKTVLFPTTFLDGQVWVLETTKFFSSDESGQEYEITNRREYNGDEDGIPLLKSVSNLAHSKQDNKLGWGDWYSITKLYLSPPDPSVFDPAQFPLEPDNAMPSFAPRPVSIWRKMGLIFGALLIFFGLYLRFKKTKEV